MLHPLVESAFVNLLVDGSISKMNPFNSNIILKKNEFLVLEFPVNYCEEKVVSSGAAHRGFSVRIMKGLWFRSGRTKSEKAEAISAIDTGKLSVTNKRLIFSGSKKSTEVRLSDINDIRIEKEYEGISISKSRKLKREFYLGFPNLHMTLEISDDENSEFPNGEHTWYMNLENFIKIIKRLSAN